VAIADLVGLIQQTGWSVCLIPTPKAAAWLDVDALVHRTGFPVRHDYRSADDATALPKPDAIALVPATFNTINKWAQGISDTLALGLLNESAGLSLPIVAVPWPNAALAGHPVFQRSIATLREWGITVLLDPARLPGTGQEPAAFPWDELRAALPGLRPQETAQPGPPPEDAGSVNSDH
jgi:hypothetical protein